MDSECEDVNQAAVEQGKHRPRVHAPEPGGTVALQAAVRGRALRGQKLEGKRRGAGLRPDPEN